MERLTKKTFDKGTLEGHWFQELRSVYGATIAKKMYLKLKDYEDIDEKLNIELSILFKAFDEGSCGVIWMFVQNDYNEEYKKGLIKPFIINYFARKPNERSFYLSVYDSLTCKNYIVDIKGYGKTWALTKEELL